jgi:hypothetical protein
MQLKLVESSGEQQHLNGAATHGQRPGVIYAFSVNAALTKQNSNNLPASAWISKLKVRNDLKLLLSYVCDTFSMDMLLCWHGVQKACVQQDVNTDRTAYLPLTAARVQNDTA